jgi:glycosyltransferase involved in cell wall biosynthesis
VKKDVEKLYGKPDVIFASSVHPLVLFSGIHIAKKYRAPCVCEVRDLWPLSLVSYGLIKESSVLTKILFISEKWIYEKADSLIFTFEGGRQYIKDKGWDKSVDPEKVFHINNGVDLEVFNEWLREYPPCTLCGENGVKRIVYAGSIGVANDVGYIVDLAKAIDLIGGNNIRFDIYGDGEYLNALKKRCIDEDIKNIEWHGFVDRKYIPGIVSGAFANIIHLKDVPLLRYGISLNKLFDYLAAGKPIIETIRTGYDIIEKYDCGISMKEHDVGKLAKDVVLLSDDCKRYGELSVNALKATEYYSFDALTKKLIKIVEGTRRLDGWKNRRN